VALHAVRAPIAPGGGGLIGPYNGAFFDTVSLTLQKAFDLPAPIPSAVGPVAATYGANLLVDTGAEDAAVDPIDGTVVAPVPGWTLTGQFTAVGYVSGRIRATESNRIGGGKASFAGGPAAPFPPRPSFRPPLTTATQTVDVSLFAADIDAGLVHAHAEAQMGTYGSDGDNGTVQTTFFDAAFQPLGDLVLGPVYATDSAYRLVSSDRAVPAGTRNVQVMLIAQRIGLLSSDAQFDNVVLSLSRGVPSLPGDVNGDGTVDVGDATIALRGAVGLAVLTPAEAGRADVDRDGSVTIADVILILRHAAGLP